MTYIDYFIEFWKTDYFPWSLEKPNTIATNSEIRRWFKQKSIIINGKTPNWNEEVDFPILQFILHPNSKKRRITLI